MLIVWKGDEESMQAKGNITGYLQTLLGEGDASLHKAVSRGMERDTQRPGCGARREHSVS